MSLMKEGSVKPFAPKGKAGRAILMGFWLGRYVPDVRLTLRGVFLRSCILVLRALVMALA